MTKEKRKHGGGDVITGSVPAIGIPCLNGLKGSVLAFSYQLSHQTERRGLTLINTYEIICLQFFERLQQTLLATKHNEKFILWFAIGTRNLVFWDKDCRLLCYAFFVLSLGRRTKKKGDISMIRGEEQVFPTLTCRHTEEGYEQVFGTFQGHFTTTVF